MIGDLLASDPPSVGPYRLLKRLGTGAMGNVYLARSEGGRAMAIKVIRPELAGDPGFRLRFAREVAAARTVSGIYTALVVDADTEGLTPWLATEYVAGPSLAAAVVEQGPLPLDSLAALAAGLAEGLAVVHAAGLVHRDLKPSNVLLAQDGPRLIDFGISRAADASTFTVAGTLLGSPGFMSPEQARGLPAGPPSDVFSLGAVLVFAATGTGPFGDGIGHALLYRVVHENPDLSGVPAELMPLIGRCLDRDPALRPTPAELLAELGAGTLGDGWLPAEVSGNFGSYRPTPMVDGSEPDPDATLDPDAALDNRADTQDVAAAELVIPEPSPRLPRPATRPRSRTVPARVAGGLAGVAAIVAVVVAVATMLSPGSHAPSDHAASGPTPGLARGLAGSASPTVQRTHSPAKSKAPTHRPSAATSFSASAPATPSPLAQDTATGPSTTLNGRSSPASSPAAHATTFTASPPAKAQAAPPDAIASYSGATEYSCGNAPASSATTTPATFTVTNDSSAAVELDGQPVPAGGDYSPADAAVGALWTVSDSSGCLAVFKQTTTGSVVVS